MTSRWRSAVAILGLIAATANGPVPLHAGDDAPAKRPLDPDPKRSFGTPTGTQFTVSLVGKDWALVAVFDQKDFPYNHGELPVVAEVKPITATYYTGPDVGEYVKPPTGPPSPPIPTTGRYSAVPVEGLIATLVAKERSREPDAHVLLRLSPFKAGDTKYAGLGEFRLVLRGPYP